MVKITFSAYSYSSIFVIFVLSIISYPSYIVYMICFKPAAGADFLGIFSNTNTKCESPPQAPIFLGSSHNPPPFETPKIG